MSLESIIRDALAAMSAVTAIVGTGNSARIRSDRFHDGDIVDADGVSQPAIMIDVTNEDKQNDLSGVGGASFAAVAISCVAPTRVDARALAEAVRTNGTNPGTGMAGYSGTYFHSTVESIATTFIPIEDGSDEGWYQCVLNCEVFTTETT